MRGNYANKSLFVHPKINGFSQPQDKKEPRNSSNYSSYSFRFCPTFECYLLNNSDFPNKGSKGLWIYYGKTPLNLELKRGY